jgi:hypothetical protein
MKTSNKQIKRIESNIAWGSVVYERSPLPEQRGKWLARFETKLDESQLQEVLNEIKTINAMGDNENGLAAIAKLIVRE